MCSSRTFIIQHHPMCDWETHSEVSSTFQIQFSSWCEFKILKISMIGVFLGCYRSSMNQSIFCSPSINFSKIEVLNSAPSSKILATVDYVKNPKQGRSDKVGDLAENLQVMKHAKRYPFWNEQRTEFSQDSLWGHLCLAQTAQPPCDCQQFPRKGWSSVATGHLPFLSGKI